MSDSALALPTAGPALGVDGAGLTDPAAFPVLRPTRVRYDDLGPDGRATLLGLGRWLEQARVDGELPRFRRLVEDGGFAAPRILLAAQRIDRLAPLERDREYRVGLGVRRIGNSSFSYGHGVFADGACVAVSDSTTVLATASGPTGLPDALRADLAAMLIDEPGGAPSPRPGAARRERAAYPVTLPVRARIADIDTNAHVNNVAVLSWYADAVADWQLDRLGRSAGGPPPALAAVAWDVQYVAEVTYPATYDVALAVSEDPEGLRYRCALFAGPRCVGLADGVGPAGELSRADLARWGLRA